MSETKVGLDQINKPAPLWYRRFTNAMIMFFIPAAIGIVQGAPMSSQLRNILMIIIGAIPAILKGFAMIMGNGQYYVPSNETIDRINTPEKPE